MATEQTDSELAPYLASSTFVDWQEPSVFDKAMALADGLEGDVAIARRCFEFVREHIQHSLDYGCTVVTVSASQVLQEGSGYCYAKSHLLAALLRANGIPAGLCYQRLSVDGSGGPYCLHGLNAVLLEDYGWYRIDARGNRDDVNASFCPPVEQLAFSTDLRLEADFPEIWPEPLPLVTDALQKYDHVADVLAHLPDVPVIGQ